MKEKYEKPHIESEKFSMEIMKAACSSYPQSKANVMPPSYPTYTSLGCDCEFGPGSVTNS